MPSTGGVPRRYSKMSSHRTAEPRELSPMPIPARRICDGGARSSEKNSEIRIERALTRQPLVKGERLVRCAITPAMLLRCGFALEGMVIHSKMSCVLGIATSDFARENSDACLFAPSSRNLQKPPATLIDILFLPQSHHFRYPEG